MNSVEIAEALLTIDGAAQLAAWFATGCKCDEVPVRVALTRMFPQASDDDLAAGLRLALSVARLDVAEAEAAEKP